MESGIYTISLALLFSSGLLSRLFKNKRLVICISCGLILGLIVGLRDPYLVGADGLRYARVYNNMLGKEISIIFSSKDGESILFYLLCWLCCNSGLPYYCFTMLSALFCVCIVSMMIYRFSSMPFLSFILYIGLGTYTGTFNIQRQSLALAFVLLTYNSLYDGHRVTAIMFFLFAVLFHPTAIIFLPVLFIGRLQFSKKMYFLLGLAVTLIIAICYTFRMQIAYFMTNSFNVQYLGFYTSTQRIGGTAIFTIFLLIFYAYSVNYADLKKNIFNNDAAFFRMSLLFTSACACIIQSFSSYAYSFTRLNLYYLQFAMFSIPDAFFSSKIRNLFGRYCKLAIVLVSVIIIALMIFQFYECVEHERLQIYKFLWEQ